jgi:hypothetical protein
VKPRVLWLAVVLGTLGGHAAGGQTLLQVERTRHALALVDPGSGLRLASIEVAAEPRGVAVSPDGKLAAVLSCSAAHAPSVTMSIVDLEHPRELRRLPLATSSCPDALTWLAADRIAVEAGPTLAGHTIDPTSGRVVGELTASDRAAVQTENKRRSTLDVHTVAVQQFLASGGDLRDLAWTPVMPRAVCHACTPDP